MAKKIKIHYCIIAILSSSFLAFGMYNIHALSGVTEGGILGLTLLFHNWFGISPAISGFVMNFACYLLGWRLLGRQFVVYSAFSATGYSVAYRICEQFEPLWPQLYDMPLLAAVIVALFVGIGAVICVRIGGAVGGDDALVMSLAHVTHLSIQWLYLICDLVVLVLSITYIPIRRLIYSLLTVILSGQIVGLIQRIRLPGSGKGGKGKKVAQISTNDI